jgi:hypothetical protein
LSKKRKTDNNLEYDSDIPEDELSKRLKRTNYEDSMDGAYDTLTGKTATDTMRVPTQYDTTGEINIYM